MKQYETQFEKWRINAQQNSHNDGGVTNCNRSSTSYEINLRCMLAAYHLGTGPQDITKLCSMLGLGNMLWFERSFTRHEAKLNEGLILVAKTMIKQALINEIVSTINSQAYDAINDKGRNDFLEFIQTKQFEKAKRIITQIKLTASFDMGWQKRATGRVYDSLSGHGYMVGCSTGKVISMGVLCKKCSTCRANNKKGIEPPLHACPVNHSGSSGGMESKLCCELLDEMCAEFEGLVVIGSLVTDDDSTIRSHCTNKNEGGKLDETTPTPLFLADPGHRIKVMGKAVFGVVQKTKNPDEVKTIDALRIKKYYSLYISQNKTKHFDEFVANARAPIEHLFDNHVFCDPTWCWAKTINDKLHNAITKTVNEKKVTSNDVLLNGDDSIEDVTTDDLSYEALENHWLEALDIQYGDGDEYGHGDGDVERLTKNGDVDEEYNPGSDVDDDEFDEDTEEEDDDDEDRNFMTDELNYELAICDVMDNYSIEKTIFTDLELDDLKIKERALIERGDKGYYRNKNTHKHAYTKICQALEPYLSTKNLKMLHHVHTTQSNEALNKSVSAYAPKHKNYSLTKSLEARVGVAASIQVGGYNEFWKNTYNHFDLEFHQSMSRALTKMDKDKNKKRERAATREGKRKRTQTKSNKLNETHRQDMKDHQAGMSYASGIHFAKATKHAKRQLNASERNPKGTPKHMMKCKYHHTLFCQTLGHVSSNNSSCAMFGKTKEERDRAEKEILQTYREEYMRENPDIRKFSKKIIFGQAHFQRELKKILNFLTFDHFINYSANEEPLQRTRSLRNGYKKF